MADSTKSEDAPIAIKKYANRRLYNTDTSSYVTLEYLCQMVKDGVDFVVYDAKTGEDITRSVLTQIIVEEEAKGQNLLPIEFLRQLIGCYGNAMQQTVLPGFLQHSMQNFMENQAQIRNAFADSFGGTAPFEQLEEMSRQNMAMFEKAMAMFNPFAAGQAGDGGSDSSAAPEPQSEPASEQVDALTRKLDALQAQIDALRRDKD